jgi:ribonuclease VapC
MVIDSSAMIAILQDEWEAERFVSTIARADVSLLSAASLVETHLAMANRLPVAKAGSAVKQLIEQMNIDVVPITIEIASVGVQAIGKYGRGHHPAGLNFGDLLSYATAKVMGLPLLFKGKDFSCTDITPACVPVRG